MTTLTSSTTFTISAGPTTATAAQVKVLPIASDGSGTGRLIHPTFGTYDYQVAPNEWGNLDQDLIVRPIWQHTMTLNGGTNVLWAGNIKDVACEERWLGEGGLSMPIAQFRMLLAMWMNPPDPASNYIHWYPSYTTSLGFKVAIESLTVQGKGGSGDISLDWYTKGALHVSGAVTLRLRIIDRL